MPSVPFTIPNSPPHAFFTRSIFRQTQTAHPVRPPNRSATHPRCRRPGRTGPPSSNQCPEGPSRRRETFDFFFFGKNELKIYAILLYGIEEDLPSKPQQQGSQLRNRVVFGLGIGITVGVVVLAGGWVFTVALAAAVFTGAREYFELVRSRGITAGMTPPPRYVSRVCSVICALMPLFVMYRGHIDVSVTSAAFVLATALLLQRGSPRFAQLSSAIFGLFYCGYLPSFWVKLRCGLAAPALNTRIGATWPILLGGQAHWTVGLVATLITISSIIAADTFAFLGGKAFGRTPLSSVSPKKTWEGTIIGFCGCIVTSVVLSKIFCWPISLSSAIGLGVLNFFGSVFGDLTESMIKRDAGVKDSGSLIPGHGGVLDRVDSYLFTGALAYNFIKTFLPLYGV
ncbi:Phosphatidate cytidylyltransferase 4 [Spatholobus suberectus]|nr:Phosphatidate cytidylyltransferase 4 [Spatholobus suberectus]